MVSLHQLLSLVGTLDDAPGDDTPRERFRRFLSESLTSLGTVRDYVEACLTTSGIQYNRALQDLINHTGKLIGFEVEFGRYSGVAGKVGNDGLWRTDDFVIVVEVKTTDVYAIRTSILMDYVNRLIEDGSVRDWDHALGLYVVGRPDAEIEQLESGIVAQKRTNQLRVATVNDILSLAEMVQLGHLSRDEAVTLLRPTSVRVGSTVQLLARIASTSAEPADEFPVAPQTVSTPMPTPPTRSTRPTVRTRKMAGTRTIRSADRLHLLTPVASDPEASAEETIRRLLDSGVYVFGDRTTGRKQLKAHDRLCFYESGKGVVAAAEVASAAEHKIVPNVRHPERFPWSFRVRNVRYFFDNPVVIDAEFRAKLDAFADRDPEGAWAWLVQGTRKVTERDFKLLTRDISDE
jgi:hypothetical protein